MSIIAWLFWPSLALLSFCAYRLLVDAERDWRSRWER